MSSRTCSGLRTIGSRSPLPLQEVGNIVSQFRLSHLCREEFFIPVQNQVREQGRRQIKRKEIGLTPIFNQCSSFPLFHTQLSYSVPALAQPRGKNIGGYRASTHPQSISTSPAIPPPTIGPRTKPPAQQAAQFLVQRRRLASSQTSSSSSIHMVCSDIWGPTQGQTKWRVGRLLKMNFLPILGRGTKGETSRQ